MLICLGLIQQIEKRKSTNFPCEWRIQRNYPSGRHFVKHFHGDGCSSCIRCDNPKIFWFRVLSQAIFIFVCDFIPYFSAFVFSNFILFLCSLAKLFVHADFLFHALNESSFFFLLWLFFFLFLLLLAFVFHFSAEVKFPRHVICLLFHGKVVKCTKQKKLKTNITWVRQIGDGNKSARVDRTICRKN